MLLCLLLLYMHCISQDAPVFAFIIYALCFSRCSCVCFYYICTVFLKMLLRLLLLYMHCVSQDAPVFAFIMLVFSSFGEFYSIST